MSAPKRVRGASRGSPETSVLQRGRARRNRTRGTWPPFFIARSADVGETLLQVDERNKNVIPHKRKSRHRCYLLTLHAKRTSREPKLRLINICARGANPLYLFLYLLYLYLYLLYYYLYLHLYNRISNNV